LYELVQFLIKTGIVEIDMDQDGIDAIRYNITQDDDPAGKGSVVTPVIIRTRQFDVSGGNDGRYSMLVDKLTDGILQ